MNQFAAWACSILCVVAFVAGLIAAFVITYRQKAANLPILQRQAELLPQWAARHGFSYTPRDDRVLGLSRRPPLGGPNYRVESSDGVHKLHWGQVSATFELFPGSRWVRGEHVMNGESAGAQTAVFQYHLRPEDDNEVSSGANWLANRLIQRRYGASGLQDFDEVYRTVAAVRLPGRLPFLAVAPQPAETKLVSGWALRDLDVELHAFNERFLVHSQIDRFTMDVLHAQMIEWMLGEPMLEDRGRIKRVGFVVDGDWCYLMGMSALDAERLDEQLALVRGFVSRIPRHVWQTRY